MCMHSAYKLRIMILVCMHQIVIVSVATVYDVPTMWVCVSDIFHASGTIHHLAMADIA